jgi:hypothetical protein
MTKHELSCINFINFFGWVFFVTESLRAYSLLMTLIVEL